MLPINSSFLDMRRVSFRVSDKDAADEDAYLRLAPEETGAFQTERYTRADDSVPVEQCG
jgi:hypothetical protein